MKSVNLFDIKKALGVLLLVWGVLLAGAVAEVMAGEHPCPEVECPPPPTDVLACPHSAIYHWDKIIFLIVDRPVAAHFGLPYRSELDIKVLDDPTTVADIKEKVWRFLLNMPGNPTTPPPPGDFRRFIRIVDVDYAISGCYGRWSNQWLAQ